MKLGHRLLEEMLRDGLCSERAAAFRASRIAVARWEQAHPLGLTQAVARIQEIRRRFGSPPPDLEPWRGDDFRL